MSATGFEWKTYWRRVGGKTFAAWHLFQRSSAGDYVSMCGKFRRQKSGGQNKKRPDPRLRWGFCDNVEMKYRGVSESVI